MKSKKRNQGCKKILSKEKRIMKRNGFTLIELLVVTTCF
ncbi:MAG: type II secretion system protein [Lentisphaeria bacterium]|nr:type II secretion system protein [Lentisphaeria bacterium]